MTATLLFAGLAAAVAGAATPGAPVSITLYRQDDSALFQGGGSPVADGYAVVHEQRAIATAGDDRSVIIDGLPSNIDAEAIAIDLDGRARILAQRVIAAGDDSLLGAHRGEPVKVFADDGQPIVEGTLIGLDGSSLNIRANDGRVSYVRDYARVVFPASGGLPGSTLQLVLAPGARATTASLTYPTSGLGWRAAYTARLAPGTHCRLALASLASIANRSGRDYRGAHLTLVAGAPEIANRGGPRPVMMKARAYAASAPAPEAMPEQGALEDYRLYTLDGTLDLPDSSVSQVPLYPPQDLDCTRTWLVEYSGGWGGTRPQLAENAIAARSAGPVSSQLRFKAAENLPAGTLRVLGGSGDPPQFLGENPVGDTPKGDEVDLTLGNAFELRAARERTIFSIDRAAHQLDEGFRVTLDNAGETARTITVRDHPTRWRAWTLASSSTKPVTVKPDLLEFRIEVPAGGKARLDYTLRYRWTAADETNR
jgi:hypothetical protein